LFDLETPIELTPANPLKVNFSSLGSLVEKPLDTAGKMPKQVRHDGTGEEVSAGWMIEPAGCR